MAWFKVVYIDSGNTVREGYINPYTISDIGSKLQLLPNVPYSTNYISKIELCAEPPETACRIY